MESNELENKNISSNIINNLHLLSDEQIVAFLSELRKNNKSDYVHPLLNILISDRSDLVRRAIVEYLSDLKNQEVVGIIVRFLEDSFPKRNISAILVACWQSRLNFSKHLNLFINILINASYLTSFEAFTVIENSVDELTVDEITNYIAMIKKGIVGSDRDKQLLLLEMVSVLDKAKREVQ